METYTKSIAEILKEVAAKPDKKSKVECLRGYYNTKARQPLKIILSLMYDKRGYSFDLSEKKPSYRASPYSNNTGLLYGNVNKLRYLLKDSGLSQIKKDRIYTDMLESVYYEDAELLINMVAQRAIKGITKPVITEATGIEFTK